MVEPKHVLSCYVAAPTLAPLVYEADHSTQVRLRDYVVSHVFTDLDEDEPEEEDGEMSCSFILFNIYTLTARDTRASFAKSVHITRRQTQTLPTNPEVSWMWSKTDGLPDRLSTLMDTKENTQTSTNSPS